MIHLYCAAELRKNKRPFDGEIQAGKGIEF